MDKDFQEVDIDSLNKHFNLLSVEYEHVESNNRVCIEGLSCKNISQIFDASKILNITENDFKTVVKQENDENTDSSENISSKEFYDIKSELLNNSSLSLTLIKKEEINNDFESEYSTDFSSSDDENYTSLLERCGGKVQKRRHRKKKHSSRVYPEKSEFTNSKLNHCSSGILLKNNWQSFQVESSPPNNATTSSGSFYIPNISSPESGYDTCSVHSPSPPNVSHLDDEQDEKKKKREILNQLLEIERDYYSRVPNHGVVPLNSVETNMIGNSEKDIVSTAFFQAQSTDEDLLLSGVINDRYNSQINQSTTDEDSLLNDVINDLYNSQINQSTTTSFGVQVPESVMNQNLILCCSPACKEGDSCKRRLSFKIKAEAKKALRNSVIFNYEKYKEEERKMLLKIKSKENNKEILKVIEYDEREEYKNLEQTNLHSAVIESEVEKVYCIVEALKCYHLDLFDINNKDKNKKTALDYAVKHDKPMPLLIRYLVENNAVQAKECCIK